MVPSHLYRDLAFVFAAAFAGGLLAHGLRKPLILGYVLAGAGLKQIGEFSYVLAARLKA